MICIAIFFTTALGFQVEQLIAPQGIAQNATNNGTRRLDDDNAPQRRRRLQNSLGAEAHEATWHDGCVLGAGWQGEQQSCSLMSPLLVKHVPECATAKEDTNCYDTEYNVQETVHDSVIDSRESRRKSLQVASRISGGGWGFKMSLGMTFLSKVTANKRSVTAIKGSTIQTVRKRIRNINKFKLSPTALRLCQEDPEKFIELYGQVYVSEITMGASFMGSIQLYNTHFSKKDTFAMDLKFNYTGFGFTVEGSLEIDKLQKNSKQYLKMEKKEFYRGGPVVAHKVGANGVVTKQGPGGAELFNDFVRWKKGLTADPAKYSIPLKIMYRNWLEHDQIFEIMAKKNKLDLFTRTHVSAIMKQELMQESWDTESEIHLMNLHEEECHDTEFEQEYREKTEMMKLHLMEMNSWKRANFLALENQVRKGDFSYFKANKGVYEEIREELRRKCILINIERNCEWGCYKDLYPDLKALTAEQAKKHFLDTGYGEGRVCRCEPRTVEPHGCRKNEQLERLVGNHRAMQSLGWKMANIDRSLGNNEFDHVASSNSAGWSGYATGKIEGKADTSPGELVGAVWTTLKGSGRMKIKFSNGRECTSKCYEYVGCYRDDWGRDYEGGPGRNGYSHDSCSRVCDRYQYFALQNGGECRCGNRKPGTQAKYGVVPDSECGGKNGKGGGFRNAIYKQKEVGVGSNQKAETYVALLHKHNGIYKEVSRAGVLTTKIATIDFQHGDEIRLVEKFGIIHLEEVTISCGAMPGWQMGSADFDNAKQGTTEGGQTGFIAANAIDGTDTYSSTARIVQGKHGSLNPWWSADLKKQGWVTKVRLTNRLDNGQSELKTLSVSVDGQLCKREAWTNHQQLVKVVVCEPPVFGKTVKVSLPGANRVLALTNVEVYLEQYPGIWNAGGTLLNAKQSSTVNGDVVNFGAKRAVDGTVKKEGVQRTNKARRRLLGAKKPKFAVAQPLAKDKFYTLWKTGKECDLSGGEKKLGEFPTLEDCAYACHQREGCNFFIYGHPDTDKKHICYWEYDQACTGANAKFVDNKYNIYRIAASPCSRIPLDETDGGKDYQKRGWSLNRVEVAGEAGKPIFYGKSHTIKETNSDSTTAKITSIRRTLFGSGQVHVTFRNAHTDVKTSSDKRNYVTCKVGEEQDSPTNTATAANGQTKVVSAFFENGNPLTCTEQYGKIEMRSVEFCPYIVPNVDVNMFTSLGSFTHTNKEENPWWQADFPEGWVSEVRIANRRDCCREQLNGFKVEILPKTPNAKGVRVPAVCKQAVEVDPTQQFVHVKCDRLVKGSTVKITLPGAGKTLAMTDVRVRTISTSVNKELIK